MFKIFLIGAGQIGSRHLQALKKVKTPLDITIIDPSEDALSVAKQRYEELPGRKHHKDRYLKEIPNGQKIDLAIVATTSNVRAKIIKNLLKKNKVRYFILEKILFDKKSDYQEIEKLFSKLKIKAWVNCPLRIRPFYKNIKEDLAEKNISFKITGSRIGLATNAVHYLDLVSNITGTKNFVLNTEFLDKKQVPSKRKGFLELNGSLYANFENGTKCELTSHAYGNAPWLIEIFTNKSRYIIRESEKKAWVSDEKNNWRWKEVKFKNPLISETTTLLVEGILKNGQCPLPNFKESVETHLQLLEPLINFLNKNSKQKYENYPFT